MQHQKIPGYLERDVVDLTGLFTKPAAQLNLLVSLAAAIKKLRPGHTKHKVVCKA